MTQRPSTSATGYDLNLGDLGERVAAGIDRIDSEETVQRIWDRDHTVWKPDPTEIRDRLGWLDLPEKMGEEIDDLKSFSDETSRFDRVVLLGMGGSSLAPEVLSKTFGGRKLVALDTTHPESIRAVGETGELRTTLFVVASKSGSTVETLSQFAYFFDEVGGGEHFVAITDPGSSLATLAQERGFRRVFLNPPDIGGRYSALSYFGLVPGALIGVDLKALLESAAAMAAACRATYARENPGAVLGVVMGEAAKAGRDKLTIFTDDRISFFGTWLEQLIGESTGKEGKGIVPIEGEPTGIADAYGSDRLFANIGAENQLTPSINMALSTPSQLGAEFFRWEFATAIAGHILSIQPFDQPNVQEAKDATNKLLRQGVEDDDPGDLTDALGSIVPGDYIAIQAYLPRTVENQSRLDKVRLRLRDRFKVATTIGFGPRFLHSTGQLHKGGMNSGVFVQVTDAPELDVSIPGRAYTFRQLLDAQSSGDVKALRAHKRRVARVSLAELEEV
jgi:glucose-6-phosphate isomerase